VLRPFLLIAAGFLPWVAIHARSLHAKSGGRFWIEPMGFGDALQTALLATFGGTFREVLLFLSPVVLLLLSPIGDFGRLGRMAMAALALLAMLDLAVAVISLQTPLTVPRYFLAFLPTGLLAASVIAARLSTVLLAAWLALCGTVSLTTAASALFPLSVTGYPAWEHHSTFLAQGGIRSLIFYLDDPLNPSLDPRQLEELGGFFLRRAGRDLPVLAVSLRPGATNFQEKSSLPRPTGIIKVSSGLLSYREDREWLVRLTENWPDTACDGDPYQDKSVACIMY
jgi:hypothetical protein